MELAEIGSRSGTDEAVVDLPDAASCYELNICSLSYKVAHVDKAQGTKEARLLTNVSGRARPGEVLAVTGPSGAGKTTLLDALGGRLDGKKMQGGILVNGQPMTSAFQRIIGYVMQSDALFPMLTVRETLLFSARLRLPWEMRYAEKRQRVDLLIAELGLQSCADTVIGNEEVRGVSGGERRRVSIGVDLIHNPKVLLLDEPTSGLDSTSALHVMQILHSIAELQHRTIVVTIHQPSFRILDLVHNFLILAQGRVVYCGPIRSVVPHFRDFGKDIPEHVNVLEYALDLVEEQQSAAEGLEPLVLFHESRSSLDAFHLSSYEAPEVNLRPKFANPYMAELWILLDRNFRNIFRTKDLFLARIGVMVVTALTMGTLFFQVRHTLKGIRQRESFFTFSLALIIFSSTEALPIFLDERRIYLRETSRGAYRTSSYVLASAIIFLPFLFLLAVIYSCTSYFMVGLVPKPAAFFTFVCATFEMLAVSNSFVILFGALVPDFISGNTIVTSFNAYFFLFSGFFVPKAAIPGYWMWVHYLSPFKYALEMMEANEFRRLASVCWDRDPGNGLCLQDSPATLRLVSAGNVHMWLHAFILAAMFVVYRVLFYVALALQTNRSRQ